MTEEALPEDRSASGGSATLPMIPPYAPDDRFFDEAAAPDGTVREGYEPVLGGLAGADLAALADDVARAVRARGARFGTRSGVQNGGAKATWVLG